jgi:hypothetical protein
MVKTPAHIGPFINHLSTKTSSTSVSEEPEIAFFDQFVMALFGARPPNCGNISLWLTTELADDWHADFNVSGEIQYSLS